MNSPDERTRGKLRRIKNPIISRQARDRITGLFEKYRVAGIDCDKFCSDVESNYKVINLTLEHFFPEDDGSLLDNEQLRDQIDNLCRALENLSETAWAALHRGYESAYPFPQPDGPCVSGDPEVRHEHFEKSMFSQSKSTQILRPSRQEDSDGVERVLVHEMIERLKCSCRNVGRYYENNPGQQGDPGAAYLISEAAVVFEKHTGKKPSATQDGLFDQIVGILLYDVCPECRQDQTRRKLIAKALEFNAEIDTRMSNQST